MSKIEKIYKIIYNYILKGGIAIKKIILIIITLLTISCTSLRVEKEIDYKLVNEDFKKSEITIGFADNFVYGTSGVNRYHARYAIDKDNINIGDTATTLMAGEVELMQLEFKYLGLLRESEKINIDKDSITITTKNGYKLKFIK